MILKSDIIAKLLEEGADPTATDPLVITPSPPDLAELAKSLQNEIEKSNANVLSLEIVRKAAKAEKLAKKIKNEAKAY